MTATRARLTNAQLAAALHLAGASRTTYSVLPELPSVTTVAAARKALKGTGLLDEGRDGMSDQTKAAMVALADPQLSINVLANRNVEPEWVETTLLTHGRDEPFVALARDDESADVAILATPTHALALIDDLATLSMLPAAEGAEPLELDLAGFAALTATADLMQEYRLDGMLERSRDGDLTITADALEEALARGMNASDPRWVVDAARVVSPPVFTAATGRMATGLAALQAAGVVAAGPGGYVLTETGGVIVTSLARLAASAGLTIAAVAPDGSVGATQLGVLRSVDAIWMVAWRELSADDARLTVYQAGTATALRVVHGLVDPLTVSGDGGAAPAVERPAARRRRKPAARAAPEAAATVPAPVAEPAWSPTHVVPAGGLATWEEPDASLAAGATLDGGLEVQVLEQHANGWAHIACSNGWSAWLDGRLLEAL